MADISPAALAARPRKAKVFDQDVTFYPITIGGIMEWDAWAQGQFRRAARFGMTDGTPEEQLDYRIEANDQSKMICFGSAHADRIEWSFTGCIYLAWISLRNGNPKLTLDETAKLFGFGSRSLDEQRLAAAEAKREIHIATGLIPEESTLGLRKPRKNEPTPATETAPASPTPTTGEVSSTTSGPSTAANQPG